MIVDLATLQPIAEDRFEAEDLCLRLTPGMIVALTLPLFAPDCSDLPLVLVVEVALRLSVSVAPNPGPFAGQDGHPHPMAIESVVASPLIVGAHGAEVNPARHRRH